VAAITPDGKRVAVGGADSEIRCYDVGSGEEICRFEEHKGAVSALKFVGGGKELVSGSADGTVRVWEMPK
jgi:WD40 repeat protein